MQPDPDETLPPREPAGSAAAVPDESEPGDSLVHPGGDPTPPRADPPAQAEPEGDAEPGGPEEPQATAAEVEEVLSPPPAELLEGAVEAVLCVAGDVIRLERVRDLLGLPSVRPVREAVAAIRERWAAAELAVELEDVGGGVRVVTRPQYAEYVARLGRKPVADRLSPALLETLSIVAYKQPVGRAEVERIRGVQCGEALRALLDRRLLKVVGRSDLPGRPLLYGTTQRFLVAFGLRELGELPAPADLSKLA